MKAIYPILVVLICCVGFSTAIAQEEGWLTATRPALSQGNWELGGNLGIGYGSTGGLIIQATPRVQFFIIDRLSIGGLAEYYKNDDFERLGAGPSATLYFLETPNFVTYLGQNLIFTDTSPTLEGISTFHGETALGINYFFTPTVAIGLSYNKLYPLDDGEILGSTTLFRTAFLIYM